MAVTPGVGAMDKSEMETYLKDSRCGVLSFVDGDKPYSVAVEHCFDGKDVYFVTSSRADQRKIQCIKKNPNACYMIFDSRREKPDLAKKGIRCRSVLIEGPIRMADIKDMDTKKMGKVKVQMLKLEAKQISNWRCPAKTCDYQHAWWETYPNLLPGK
jgi:nitroimidazol reductase NimA-like FMN-containing flavoprotein (pyridoxamine 5'-phosphate oxidase superfamily)